MMKYLPILQSCSVDAETLVRDADSYTVFRLPDGTRRRPDRRSWGGARVDIADIQCSDQLQA